MLANGYLLMTDKETIGAHMVWSALDVIGNVLYYDMEMQEKDY